MDGPDPNERFRARRLAARRRRRRRRAALLALVATLAGAALLGARVAGEPITGGGDAGRPSPKGQSEPLPPRPKPPPLPAEIRGVHVTMALASMRGKLGEYFALAKHGLNTIELDVKDENGEVAFASRRAPLARAIGAAKRYYDPRRAARAAADRGIYLIGRVVVFEDPILARKGPQLAIRRRDGGIWVNDAGLGWTNPYDERVWKYNVDVAASAVVAGFDEIMFDYVRFPTDGDVASAVYPRKRRGPKSATIARFLAYAGKRLRPLGARVSAAVFGLSAARDVGIGQETRRLARELDVIYPMVYPSHYGRGEYGLEDPNAVPGRTVARSLRDFRRKLRRLDTELVPWLQDFSLGRTYGPDDVRAQIDAARRLETRGFLLWNADGEYTEEVLAAP